MAAEQVKVSREVLQHGDPESQQHLCPGLEIGSVPLQKPPHWLTGDESHCFPRLDEGGSPWGASEGWEHLLQPQETT